MPSVTKSRRKNTAPVISKWSDSDSDANQYSSFVKSLADMDKEKLDSNDIGLTKERRTRQPPKKTFEDEDLDELQFEGGGSKKKGKKAKPDAEEEADASVKADAEAAKKVKNLFSKADPLGHTHLKEVGDDLQKHGSKEKTGFMEKEADFVKNLKGV